MSVWVSKTAGRCVVFPVEGKWKVWRVWKGVGYYDDGDVCMLWSTVVGV